MTVEGARPQTLANPLLQPLVDVLKAPRFLRTAGLAFPGPIPVPIPPVPSLCHPCALSRGHSLVQSQLQSLLLAPGFLDAVPHLGQEILQVIQQLGLILPELHPELPDLLSAGRAVFWGEHPPRAPEAGPAGSFTPHFLRTGEHWGR